MSGKYWYRTFSGLLIGAALFAGTVLNGYTQSSEMAIVSALQSNPKLNNAQEVLADFTAGEAETRVIVTLKPSPAATGLAAESVAGAQLPEEFRKPGAPTYYNLKDMSIRKRLKATVEEQVARVIGEVGAPGITVTNRFSYQFGFSALVTPAGLEQIVNNPNVILVEKDRLQEAQLAQGIPLMSATAPRSIYTGAGISIAITDTGIDTAHPQLGNGGSSIFNSKVIGGYDTGGACSGCPNDADPRPGSSGVAHGTACAGIAGGDLTSVGDYIGGVAPGVKLYALKISYGTGGYAWDSDTIEAWNWIVTHQYDDPSNPIMIISHSFGGGRYYSACDSSLNNLTTAAARAVAAGITMFASSGNDGYCDSMGAPACISYINSVGAVYDANFGTYYPCVNANSCASKTAGAGCSTGWYASDSTAPDLVTSYSNSASFLNLFAPSNAAYTADITGAGGYTAGNYTSFGGTSAACPYAAGAAAVLQSAAKSTTGGFLTPAQVRQLLVNNGNNVTDSKVALTKPRVNLTNAVNALILIPDVTTQAVTAIDTTTATGHGNITDLGTPNPTQHGVCWSTSSGPTTSDNCTRQGAASATGAFSSAITGLTPNRRYFVRAYATNSVGTGYGNQVFFRTLGGFPWYFLSAVTSSGATSKVPATYWGALSYLYCPSSTATFSLTSGGVTKKSVCQAGGCSGGSGTFAGWVTTTPGKKSFSWSLTATTCGTWKGVFSYTLLNGKNYLFFLDLNSSNQPVVYVAIGTGKPKTAGYQVRMLDEAGSSLSSGDFEIIDRIPLDVPPGAFGSSRKGLGVSK